MLILTRRIEESLLIDDNIEAMPLGVKGNQVRWGVKAPQNVTVLRKEFYDKLVAKPGALEEFIESKKGVDTDGTLILTRRVGENLIIGRDGVFDITLAVLGVKGNQVRCGIEAPKSVNVHREEIQRKIESGHDDFNRHPKAKPAINGNR